MRTRLQALRHDRRGATAAEFAIAIPVLLMLMFATFQVGVLYYANAGLQNAVGEGARVATLWPRRTPTEITNEIEASRFGLNPDNLDEPELAFGQTAGQDWVDITLTYNTSLDFVFFQIDGIQLQETRRAYMP
jgi:Flp pilus assembly protein TadG